MEHGEYPPIPANTAEARELAKDSRERAKEERELYNFRAGKVKDVLHPSVLVMAIVYPVVIGFTLQARGWHFSLMHGRPAAEERGNCPVLDQNCPVPDQWVTFSAVVFQRTVYSFTAYTLVHAYLLGQLRIVSPNAPQLAKSYSVIAPVFFLGTGLVYFYTYVSLSGYGVHLADWITMAIFSGILIVITFLIMKVPLCTSRVIQNLE